MLRKTRTTDGFDLNFLFLQWDETIYKTLEKSRA